MITFQISYETVNEWNITHTVFDGKLFTSKKEAEEYATTYYRNRYKIVETLVDFPPKLLKRFNYRERMVGGKLIPPLEILKNKKDYEVLLIWAKREEFQTIKIPYELISKEIMNFNTDNHQVCIIEVCGKVFYLDFSDNEVRIGKKILKSNGDVDTDYPTL